MLIKSSVGIVAMILASAVPGQQSAQPPLDHAQRAAIADQVTPSASPFRTVSSAELQAFKKACESVPCRRNVTIHLLKKDGTFFDQKPELLPPMIQDGFVTLYPGDKVRLIPVFKYGKLRDWRLAPDPEEEAPEVISIEFRQVEGEPGMMATISKNSGPAIKLSLGMLVIDGPDHPVKTSSCALRSGKWMSTEAWPFPIYSLLIGKVEQLPDGASETCE